MNIDRRNYAPRLSDLKDKFTCTACGKHGADVRPKVMASAWI
jgi:transcription elongation factor Elf1